MQLCPRGKVLMAGTNRKKGQRKEEAGRHPIHHTFGGGKRGKSLFLRQAYMGNDGRSSSEAGQQVT